MQESGQDNSNQHNFPSVEEVRNLVEGDNSQAQDTSLDKKKREPAEKDSKQAVITILDEKLTHPKSYTEGQGVKVAELKPNEKPNVHIIVTRFDIKGDERMAIIEVGETIGNGREERKYTFTNAPDGLQVEPVTHFTELKPPITVETVEEAGDILGIDLKEVVARAISEKEQREKGLAFFSQQDAEDLADLIRESEPVIYNDDEQD